VCPALGGIPLQPTAYSLQPFLGGATMSDTCTDIHAACESTFREIVVACARLTERVEAMDRRVESVAKAVVGNGSPRDSLLARVERLEASAATRAGCADRFWKVLAVVASVAAVVVAILR
jgi:hypothetical protein